MTRLPPALLVFLVALAVVSPYMLGPPRPSVDTELARGFAAAWPHFGWQRSWSGGSPISMGGQPGLAALTALIAKTGISFERAYLWLTALCYAASVAGAFYLARSRALPASWVALAFSLAPFHLSDLVRAQNGSHALALALLPFVLLLGSVPGRAIGLALLGWCDVPAAVAAAGALMTAGVWISFRRKGIRPVLDASLSIVVAAALVSAWLTPPERWNLLPEVELATAMLAGWLTARSGRLFPIAACVSVFAAGLSWMMLFERPETPRPVQPATLEWLNHHAAGECSLGAPVPRPALNPVRRQAEDLILGPGHQRDSLLWLQALGISHLVSADARKYASVLEAEYEDEAGHRVYKTPLRRPATAVIVSRYQWRTLPRLRSLHDRASLAAYVNWSNRPEAAGFRWKSDSSAEIPADLGPDDMILVRQNAARGWNATLQGRPLRLLMDPIGFMLLDPGQAGPVSIELSYHLAGWRGWLAGLTVPLPPLPTYVAPVINPGGIVDGVRLTPPPFAPGTVITIWGTDLGATGATRVRIAGRSAEVLYADDQQINGRLPAGLPSGPVELVVEAGGVKSDPVTVEIGPRPTR